MSPKTEGEMRLIQEAAAGEIEEVEANREQRIKEIKAASAAELAKIAKQEALEEPHLEEPHGDPKGNVYGEADTGLADAVITQLAAQQEDTVTDPLLNAWQDSAGNELTDEGRNYFYPGELLGAEAKSPFTGSGELANEATLAGSLGNQNLGPGNYYIQDPFNLTALKSIGGVPFSPSGPCVAFIDLTPEFTAPNPVTAGEVVGFDGMESVISQDWTGLSLGSTGTYSVYHWNFGDGSAEVSGFAPGAPTCKAPWLSPCAGSVFHTFAHPGTYRVTLTIDDTSGNRATVSHEVTVGGTVSAAGGTGTTGATGVAGTAGAAGSSSTTGGAASTEVPAPTVQAAPTTVSLKSVLKHGLTVRYDVNEQVAGVAEVLIAATTAKHLHIHAPRAASLPAQFPASLLLARAVLATQKGGAGAVRLTFAKSTLTALRGLHKVDLTLRVVVHNAARTNPQTVSLLSAFVLSH